MKLIYLDCCSGLAGNMLLGALMELGVGEEALRAELAGLRLAGWRLTARQVKKGALSATLAEVEVTAPQPHRNLTDILALIADSTLPAPVKERSAAVFHRLAQAEAEVHGEPVEQVHFHEVGAVDAIIDVVGTVAGLHRLGVEKVFCSALPLARGWVQTAHGALPLPAPATALLLRNVPTYGVEGEAELVTPTGAALAAALAESFGPQPPMVLRAVGLGAGNADLPHPNVLRAFLGESAAPTDEITERLALLETNIDDMNPEFYESVMARVFAAGALDVYLTPIIMKKSRPAVLLSALCSLSDKDAVFRAIIAESTTLGVRIQELERRCLAREFREVETPWGKVRIKVARLEGKIVSAAPEYEDCKRLANQHNLPVREIYDTAKALAWEAMKRR